MFQAKAKVNLRQSDLKILAAYYGLKTSIKEFVNTKISAHEDLASPSLD